MKKLILAMSLSLVGFSNIANAHDEAYQPECKLNALKAVAAKANVSRKSVTLYNASLIGDGASAVEAIATEVKGMSGFWIVTMNYDDCSVLQEPTQINN